MGKISLTLESPTTFDERFKVTSVPFFISDFNLLSCELDNLHLKFYIESFYIDIILKLKKFTILSAPCEKSKKVSFTYSIMKTTVASAFGSQDKLPVKLICCVAFR